MTYDDDTPKVILAHAGSVLTEIHSYEKPEPHDKRVEHPLVAWEMRYTDRVWVMAPWCLYGFEARRWEWPEDVDDVDIRLELTQIRPTEVVARYAVDEDGKWELIVDDEQEDASATG